jgi:hypothetical protein
MTHIIDNNKPWRTLCGADSSKVNYVWGKVVITEGTCPICTAIHRKETPNDHP